MKDKCISVIDLGKSSLAYSLVPLCFHPRVLVLIPGSAGPLELIDAGIQCTAGWECHYTN